MAEFTMRVDLPPGELLLLDGKVGAETQEAVQIARDVLRIQAAHSLTERRAAIVAEMLAHARKTGHLRFVRKPISYCVGCLRSADYGGRRKNKLIPLYGFDCSTDFVSVQYHASIGGCGDCLAAILPAAKAELAYVQAEIPDALHAADAPRWKRWPHRKCKQCGWTGNEGQLGKLPALMGGYYPGKCPSCGAENTPFGRTIIESLDGFDVEPAPAPEAKP